jgi:hypothetical protein
MKLLASLRSVAWALIHRSRVNDEMATVLAVMPAGFNGTEREVSPEVYVPQSSWVTWVPDEHNTARTVREFEFYARLLPGATLDQARAQLQGLSATLSADYPEANAGRDFTADWQVKSSGGQMKVLSILLLAIAGAVFLIA